MEKKSAKLYGPGVGDLGFVAEAGAGGVGEDAIVTGDQGVQPCVWGGEGGSTCQRPTHSRACIAYSPLNHYRPKLTLNPPPSQPGRLLSANNIVTMVTSNISAAYRSRVHVSNINQGGSGAAPPPPTHPRGLHFHVATAYIL